MTVSISKYASSDELSQEVARRLLDRLVAVQQEKPVANLCLTGGRIAMRIYQSLAEQVADSGLDVARLALWWGDERFVDTASPDRNAGPALAILAAAFPLDPALTHPMPGAEGVLDAAASAATYAKELGDTTFDICLLGMGEDGHVASLFPNHPALSETKATVVGVTDSPKPPPDRISLTLPALSRSTEVWLAISGTDKAVALAKAVADDPEVPAGLVRGRGATRFFVDRAAAALLPDFNCSL